MTKRNTFLMLGLLVAALFVLVQVMFIVHEGEAAVRTTFGRPVGSITEPGLFWRWPWPVQQIDTYDARIQLLDGTFEQTLTRDGKTVIATLYAGWRIDDPLRYRERVGSRAQAELNLNGLLSNYKSAVIGQVPLSALVNLDEKALKFEQIEKDILGAAKPEAKERYGIELAFVGIRKLSLPESIVAKVYDRMREERNKVAEDYRSQGDGEAIRIRAEADSQREQLLAKAAGDARRIRAEADAAAAKQYAVFEQDPDLAMFLRKLEVLEETLGDKATVVLGADTEPFDLLKGATPPPAKAESPAGPQ